MPYSHLLPVVQAEREWGNSSVGEFAESPDGWWYLVLRAPMHLDRLAVAFDFPDHVRLGRSDDGATWVVDAENRVRIASAGTRRPPWFSTGRGLLARVTGR